MNQIKKIFTLMLKAKLFLLFLTQVIFMQCSYAQRVQPMVYELEPIGTKSSTSLRIENTQQQSITVEIIATKISMDKFGNETLSPAEDDFLIYPPQTLIEKGKTQMVRVRYIGDPTIKQSEAYRVSIKQLPVNLKEDNHTGVGMVINFNTLANITPKNSRAELKVIDISDAGNGKWNLVIENSGDRFSRLSQTSWEVSSTLTSLKKTKKIKSLEIGKMTEKNLVLPHSKLHLLIPQIDGFAADSTKILISQN